MAMLRLASSKVVPNTLRAIASPRLLTNAFGDSQASIYMGEHRFIISHHFSTDAKKKIDGKLAKLLKSEIKFKKLFLQQNMPAVPANFPFTIEDDPSAMNITLTREFDGEKIDVVVETPRNIPQDHDGEDESDSTDTSDDDDDDGGDSDGSNKGDDVSDGGDEEEEKEEEPLELNVTISKENGNKMEFDVSVSPDEIEIQTMSFKEPAESGADLPLLCFGPHRVEENQELQVALKEYLGIRGIKEANYGFLYDYMVKKSKIRPMLALKKLRRFIKE